MPSAIMFPGQGPGSNKVGMGRDIWEYSSRARKVFFEADHYLNGPLSELCFFGPEEELLKTSNAQLASLVVNLAYAAVELEFIPDRIHPANYLAGHSVGIYAAYVYAGVITFHQALDCVKERGRVMTIACQENPGKMIVLINPKIREVKRLQKDLGLGGNDNSLTQIVLSGRHEAIKEAEAIIKQRNLARKVLPLQTEGAFHSDCMKPAQESLAGYLEPVHFSDPKIPIIANSRNQLIKSATEAKGELINHLTLPVRWYQSIKTLRRLGVTSFIEMGYGEVLSNNLRRGLKSSDRVQVMNVIIGRLRQKKPSL